MAEPKNEPQPTQPDPLADLAAEDPGFDPELDAQIRPEKPAALPVETEPVAAIPDRGPDGRFLPKVEVHDPNLVEMALDLGMAQSDIDSTPAAELPRLVKHLHKQSLKWVANRSAPTPEPAIEDERLGIEDEDQIHPPILEFMKKQNKEIRDLRSQVIAGERQRQNESNAAYADRMFAEHGSPAKTGAGGMSSLKQGSEQQLARLAAVDTAIRLAGQGATAAQQIQQIPKALKLLGMDKAAAPLPDDVDAELAARKAAWNGGGVALPTHRKAAEEPLGVKRAARAVAAKLKEQRITDADFDDLVNTLPD